MITAVEWEHLAASAEQLLSGSGPRHLADLEPVSMFDGRLILAGTAETLR